jgi:hypothetical protein
VEMGRETHVCAGTRVPTLGPGFRTPTDHPHSLTLTDMFFSAKVGSSTVGLRISKTVTGSFGTRS